MRSKLQTNIFQSMENCYFFIVAIDTIHNVYMEQTDNSNTNSDNNR